MDPAWWWSTATPRENAAHAFIVYVELLFITTLKPHLPWASQKCSRSVSFEEATALRKPQNWVISAKMLRVVSPLAPMLFNLLLEYEWSDQCVLRKKRRSHFSLFLGRYSDIQVMVNHNNKIDANWTLFVCQISWFFSCFQRMLKKKKDLQLCSWPMCHARKK